MMGKTKSCYFCGTSIDQTNDSREHIIPNSIGGRRKVKGFVCSNCNSTSGDGWESELAKQLNPLCLFFGIERERGSVPSQKFVTTGNEEYVLNHNGSLDLPRPEYCESVVDAGVEINIRARSMKEAKQLLARVARNHPHVDLSQLLEQARSQSSYCSDMLHFNVSFGGANAGRSIVKAPIALLATLDSPPPKCHHADEYLLNEEGKACFGYYYEKDLVKNRPAGVPFHCVHVEGRAKTNEIMAYVEYFAVQRVVMLLSENYEGDDFSMTYALNPQDGTELSLEVAMDITRRDIFDAYEYKKIPEGSVEEALGRVIEARMSQQQGQHQSDVINKAVTYAFENCGAKYGETLTAEHFKKVTGLLMEKLEPYLIHRITSPRRRGDA